MKLYKAPHHYFDKPAIADRMIVDAAEVHAINIHAARCGVTTWWGMRSTVTGAPGYIRDAVTKLRKILQASPPAATVLMTLEAWQLHHEYGLMRHLESRELVRRMGLQDQLCELISAYDPRWSEASSIRDHLRDEAARRFAALFPAAILQLAAA